MAMPRWLKRTLVGAGATVALLALTYGALRLWVYDIIEFKGSNRDMWPTLGKGAVVVVNRRATPRRGDLVVMRRDDGRSMIRRVVAVPGDTWAFIDLKPFVDGVKVGWGRDLGEARVDGRIFLVRRETLGGATYTIFDDIRRRMNNMLARKVEGGYFVLADNREHVEGQDSRTFGPVPRERIRGVVSWVLDDGETPYVHPLPPEAPVTPGAGRALTSEAPRPPPAPIEEVPAEHLEPAP